MLAKLLALITQLKAAGVTVVLLAGATTATVAATSPQVQDAVNQLTTNVGLTRACDDGQGQPAVVAQRNAADKLLRAAYQKDAKALEDLRGGGKDVDNKAVGEIVRNYSDQLRGVLNTALNTSASLTLGREGQVRKAEASASPSGSATPTTAASPSTSASAKPTCTPAPSTSASASPSASPKPSPSSSASPSEGSSSAKVEGRVTVAERTTLDAALQAIVDKATKDMDDLVKKATDEVAKVPAPEHGKPSDNPGNKPSDKGKPTATP